MRTQEESLFLAPVGISEAREVAEGQATEVLWVTLNYWGLPSRNRGATEGVYLVE